MIKVVCLGGTGDAYLVSGLLAGAPVLRERSTVAVRERYMAIPRMFGMRCAAADEEIDRAQADAAFQRTYDNALEDGRSFYAHPCFVRTPVRLDDLTVLPRSPSQADMYRVLLGLPEDSPLVVPAAPAAPRRHDLALLAPRAVSWPNSQPAFWTALATDLRSRGWEVVVNDEAIPLGDLISLAATAGLVIAPQCGFISMVVAAQFPARVVIATPSVEEGPGFPVGTRWVRRTYPYAYVSKFDGLDYDVDEYRIRADNHRAVISNIVNMRRYDRDPRPAATVWVPVTPGDALDRLAVLSVKRHHAGASEREYQRYDEITADLRHRFVGEYATLADTHHRAYEVLARLVPGAMNGGASSEDQRAAVLLNRHRVELRNVIDHAAHAPYSEGKDYYHGEHRA